jgi:DNA-binding transcriptional MocR family regulator
LPSLWSLAPDVVLQLGTTSKTFFPGVRLGWATGPAEVITQLVVAKHEHENEQLTWIVEGTLRLWLGEDGDEEMFDVAAGEVLHIPSHVPHRAEALEDTLDVDIFQPPRADWLDGSDAYLRQK